MSFSDRDGVIWFDGQLVPWREAKVHVLTHTLHYGLGVFEGVRAYETQDGVRIFRLQDHTDRLLRSAHILGMNIPFSREELMEAQRTVVRENNLSQAYLRPMCFYGSEGMGLKAQGLGTHCIVAAWEWPSYVSPQTLKEGIKVRTSSYTRHHVNITLCKAKSNGNYVNSMLALQEAVSCGCDEAVMLDNEGYVAEGSAMNIFIVKPDGVLCTPGGTSCLEGITRDTIMQLAREQGWEVREKRITRDEVYIASEAFMTGTAAEILPVREYDGRVIGDGSRGPVTSRLQTLYFDQVSGKRQQRPEWLTDPA
ncbi:MAG: branched-chain amino acid transaminase [Kistimonas sp.]|nr:branched-chain amino acid transaminase [Kistimonas sp.]